VVRRRFSFQLIVKRRLAMSLFLACATAAAQPRYGLSPDAYAVFAQWMATTCVGEDAEAWKARLVRHRAELAPAFRRALADGPAEAARATVRASADVRYRALATFPIAEYRVVGAAAPGRAARQSFVDDEVARYVAGYKSNAIAGLAVLSDGASRSTLARIAAQRGNALALPAAEALRALNR
jgi:hypothetical protein